MYLGHRSSYIFIYIKIVCVGGSSISVSLGLAMIIIFAQCVMWWRKEIHFTCSYDDAHLFSISYSFIKCLVPSEQRTGAWLIELRNWISFDILVSCVVPFTMCRCILLNTDWKAKYVIFIVRQEPNKLILSNICTWKWLLNKLKHQQKTQTTLC